MKVTTSQIFGIAAAVNAAQTGCEAHIYFADAIGRPRATLWARSRRGMYYDLVIAPKPSPEPDAREYVASETLARLA